MNDMSQDARFSILSSFENVANLAEDVSVLCGNRAEIDEDTADMLRLCLAEALNNIVEHAYQGAEGKPIFADVQFMRDRFEVHLIDEGQPMPQGQVPSGDADYDLDDFENLPEGGFGWMLIRSQMDMIEYERRDGCNVLRLGKELEA
ncbi:MAG: ATP-binding protein [Pseudomonadota bacterium]